MEESAPCATEQAEEAEPDLPLVDFGVVVGGKARFDVCRLFLASLQLVSAVAECLYRVPLLALLVSLYEPGAMANPGESTQRLGYFYSVRLRPDSLAAFLVRVWIAARQGKGLFSGCFLLLYCALVLFFRVRCVVIGCLTRGCFCSLLIYIQCGLLYTLKHELLTYRC